jgi:hypothetical protein
MALGTSPTVQTFNPCCVHRSARFGDQLIPMGQAILRGASGDRKEMCGHTAPILSADGRIM